MNGSFAAQSHEKSAGWWKSSDRSDGASSRSASNGTIAAAAAARAPSPLDPAQSRSGADDFASTEWRDTEWADTRVDI